MMESCWNGTRLSVDLASSSSSHGAADGEEPGLLAGRTYLVRMSFEVDGSHLPPGPASPPAAAPTDGRDVDVVAAASSRSSTDSPSASPSPSSSSSDPTSPRSSNLVPAPLTSGSGGVGRVWFRLILCDDSAGGFCHPFVYDRGGGGDGSSGDGTFLRWVSREARALTRTVGLDLMPAADGGGVEGEGDGDGDVPNDGIPQSPRRRRRYAATAELPLTLPADLSGRFFFIGHATLFLSPDDDMSTVHLRADIADAIPAGFVTVEEEPVILTVTFGFKVAASVVAALCFIWQAFLLWSIWRHRRHVVLRVAQAPFLALLVSAGGAAVASSVLFMPLSDASCNLREPMTLIPCTLIGAVMVGRIWRAHCVLADVLSLGTDDGGEEERRTKDGVMNFLSLLADWKTLLCVNRCRGEEVRQRSFYGRRSTRNLRDKVTNRDLLRLVVTLTAPQCVLQAVRLAVSPERVRVEFFGDGGGGGAVGATACTRGSLWLSLFALALLGATFLLSILVSWVASDLPSVFNEKHSIFAASWISILLFMSGGGLLLVSESMITSPDVNALLWMLLVICLSLTTSWVLVMPKLRKIWSGEPVILSNLLKSAVRSNRELQSEHSSSQSMNMQDPPTPLTPPGKEMNPNMMDFPVSEEMQMRQETYFEALTVQDVDADADILALGDENGDAFVENEESKASEEVSRGVSHALTVGDDNNDTVVENEDLEVPKEVSKRISWCPNVKTNGDAPSIGDSSSESEDSFDVEGLETIETKMKAIGNRRRSNEREAFAPPLGTCPVPQNVSQGSGPMPRKASLGAGPMPRKASLGAGPIRRNVTLGAGPVQQTPCPVPLSASPTPQRARPNFLDADPIPVVSDPLTQLNQVDLTRHATTGAVLHRRSLRSDRKVRLKRTSAPPKGLEMRLLKMREGITKVTTATLEGRQAPLKVWKVLQMDAISLASQLQNVEFDWTEDEENGRDDLKSSSWHSATDGLRDLRQNLAKTGGKFRSNRSLMGTGDSGHR